MRNSYIKTDKLKRKRRAVGFAAIVLTVCMLCTFMPSAAFASTDPAPHGGNDVVYGSYGRDGSGSWTQNDSLDGSRSYKNGDTDITYSKTASRVAGEDNTYKVDLNVSFTQSEKEVPPGSAATVLVMDTSGSMNACAECGSDSHDKSCSHYNDSRDHSVTSEQTRMAAAKNQAAKFVDSFRDADGAVPRYVSLVWFNDKSYKTDWYNVSEADGYNTIISKIDNIDANYTTNTPAALNDAYGLITDQGSQMKSVEKDNKNVILLTDGVPTESVSYDNEYAYNTPNISRQTKIAADALKENTKLYTICFGAEDDMMYPPADYNSDGAEEYITCSDFLKSYVASSSEDGTKYAYDAKDGNALAEAFKAITESVISGINAGTVSDGLPSGVKLAGNGNVPEGMTADGNGWSWELKADNAVKSTGGNKTVYKYTTSYKVKLDVDNADFNEDVYYPLNTRTTLTIKDGTADRVLDFDIPAAKANIPETSVSVRKIWSDADNQDGIRPDRATVELLADGNTTGRSVVLNKTNDWTAQFDNLPVKKAGKNVSYTVRETNLADGYTAAVKGSATEGFTVTNTHTPDTIKAVNVSKVWSDADNQDGIRPDSVTVKLLADGKDTGRSVKLNADNNWKGQFDNLAAKNAGKTVKYTVEESKADGYTSVVKGSATEGFTVINTHTPDTIKAVNVSKVWSDAENQDGIRPDSVTVKLLADGKDTGRSVKLNADNNWKGQFDNLAAKNAGKTVKYTVEESKADGYTSVVKGSATEGFTVTNTHRPDTIKAVNVSKVWSDAENQDGIRPASVTVKLLADGQDTGKSVKLNAGSNWKGQFTDLAAKKAGKTVKYTVEENKVDGYTAAVTGSVTDGFTVTNTHEVKPDPDPNPPTPPVTNGYTLTYVTNGSSNPSSYEAEGYAADKDAAASVLGKTPQKDGYKFNGWYTDEGLTDRLESGEKLIMNKDRTVYAGWEKLELNKTDHQAYVMGYEDGTVRPQGRITRAEVATIFFRLLSEDTRSDMWSTSNGFSDVEYSNWFNNAVSTMANGGIAGGYPDGSFKPNAAITRAEFATIAAKFDPSTPDISKSQFTDVSGHWAEKYIKKAEALGYISGYPDGSFKPDNAITRAEAMSLINRVLDRDTVELSGLKADQMVNWPDNADKAAWYYLDVQEATNSHDWETKDSHEVWTGIKETRDWKAVERPGGSLDASAHRDDITSASVS